MQLKSDLSHPNDTVNVRRLWMACFATTQPLEHGQNKLLNLLHQLRLPPDFSLHMLARQPLIPVATILEGALLGALDTGYIAKRTGVSLCLALAIIYGSQMVLHLGLVGVWIGMGTFFASNAVMDTFRIMSPGSPLPVAVLPELD